MGNIVIVIESAWKNMGTAIHPYNEKRFDCFMYKVDDASSSALPQTHEDDRVWFYSLSSFKRQFKHLIEEYLEEYEVTMRDFEYDLYAGLTLERIDRGG